MAMTVRETIIPNRGRKPKKKNRSAARRASGHKSKGHRPRTKKPKKNPNLIGLTMNKGRKPAKKGAMGMSKTKKKKNTGHRGASAGHRKAAKRKNTGRSGMMRAGHSRRPKKNAGSASRFTLRGVGDYVINGLFVIAGAVGTKLITQMILGASNAGMVGYGVNALTGAVLWFATEKVLKNPAASAGVISGTIVQIILRAINDYTPFGSYLAQAGFGDYQAQAFLTPQILVDPYNSAKIRFPPALLAAAAAGMPAPAPNGGSTAAKMSAAVGVAGFDPLYSGGGSLY